MIEDREEQRPSAVRRRIMEGHETLRSMLDGIAQLAEGLRAGEQGARDSLRSSAESLLEAFEQHLELEDRILAPALEETPGFGPERSREMVEHHERQQEMLRAAISELHDADADALADRITEVARDLREDMEREDRDLLGPKVRAVLCSYGSGLPARARGPDAHAPIPARFPRRAPRSRVCRGRHWWRG